ncbi:SH3 domain-containing protein [Cellvibrio mixtus]|uniref:SH3 domain-containing protein n=1 Tax=Cellvibrio mixtus TaxID=39650 RepID=UPI0005873ECA|nr:SH3 domain-containing protein [Cellvibrio mixtus]
MAKNYNPLSDLYQGSLAEWRALLDPLSEYKYALEIGKVANQFNSASEILGMMNGAAQPFRSYQEAYGVSNVLRELNSVGAWYGLTTSLDSYRKSMELDVVSDQVRAIQESASAWKRLVDPLKSYQESFDLIRGHTIQNEMFRQSVDAWAGLSQPLKQFKEALGWVDELSTIKSANELFISDLDNSVALGYLRDQALGVYSEIEIDNNEIFLSSKQIAAQELQELSEEIIRSVSLNNTSGLEKSINDLVSEIKAQRDPWLQKLLAWFIYPLLVGIIIAIITPIAEHHVGSFLKEDKKSVEKKIRAKAIQSVGNHEILKSIRYVSADRLNVRLAPSKKSDVIGVLQFSYSVLILEKRKSWTLVEWRDVDSDVVIKGWVFSRYLKKFR